MIDDRIEIELDKKRTLKFKNSSCRALERVLGTSIKKILFRFQKSLMVASDSLGDRVNNIDSESPQDILADLHPNERGKLGEKLIDSDVVFSTDETTKMLWASLIHEDKDLTIEDVDDLMDLAPGDGMAEQEQYVFTRVMIAFLLRTAPRSRRGMIKKLGDDLLKKSDEMLKASSGETGEDSEDLPSEQDSESVNSGT